MWNALKILLITVSISLALTGCGGSSSSSGDDASAKRPPNVGGGNGGNGGNGGGSTPPDDTTTPPDDGSEPEQPPEQGKTTVVATDPEDNSQAVDAGHTLSVQFDAAIDPGSVGAANVSLLGPAGEVNVSVTVDGAALYIKPATTLARGAAYTATVKAGVRSLDGGVLEADYSWQFAIENEIVGLCAGFYSQYFSLVQGKDATLPSSSLTKPVRGVPYTDPVYKTCVTRASNAKGELGVGWVRNDYSRRQAFNADDSRYLVIARYGRWFLHNTKDTRIVREVPLGGGNVEPQWHPTNPDLIYVFDNNGGYTIRTHNVKTDERKVVADLRKVSSIAGHPGLTSITQIWPTAARVWTQWEGSPSRDARYWALLVQTSDQKGLGMVTYDLVNNVITGVYDFAKDGNWVPQPNYVSMSPSGKYLVAGWSASDRACSSYSALGTRSNPCGTMSFSRDLKTAVGLSTKGEHSDIGIDANGRDVYVYSSYASGWVVMRDLATGAATNLWQIYVNGNSTAMHISTKNFAKPGWALISTYMEKAPGWYVNKVMAVEMKANPRILNLAHTYNKATNYWSEVHASVNRDFTRVVFNSNWGSGGEDMDVYMITLPDSAVPAVN